MHYIQQPQAIESKSFAIIDEIIRETRPSYRFASPLHEAIIKRVIHTTADFDWLDILWFSPDALARLTAVLSRPSILYTDTAWRSLASTRPCWPTSVASAVAISVMRG